MIKVYKKLFFYVPEKKFLAFWAIFFSLLSSCAGVGSYYFLYLLLQDLVLGTLNTQSAINNAWIFAGLLALSTLLYFCSGFLSHLLGFRLETNLRKRGIRGLEDAGFSFYDTHSSGTVRKLIDDNAALTHNIVAHLIPDQAEAVLAPFLVVILSFVIDWRLGIFLVLICVSSLILFKLMTGEQEFMVEYNKLLDKMAAEMVEFVRSIPVVKIFGTGISSFSRLNHIIHAYSKSVYKYSLSCRRPYVLFQLVFLGIAAIAILLTLPFAQDPYSSGEIIVFLMMSIFLTGTLFSSIMKVMYVSMYASQGIMAVEKLEELFKDVQQEKISFGTCTSFDNYDIEFDNVSFGYTDQKVFDGLSFKLTEGKVYALVGSSGGGKSTLVKLLSGFYKLDGGAIKIGGKPLEDYTEKAVLGAISFVFQDVKLFKTSLYENVKLARPNASHEEVMTALEAAGCNDILDKFPDREQTVIGSKGVYISGGETQRIAIARAMLKDSPIVVFDEASAAIDPDNEHALQQAFSELMKNKTVIFIAHRLSSIRGVDEILVIDKGELIERGSDKELMENDSVYARLQRLYLEANNWEVQHA